MHGEPRAARPYMPDYGVLDEHSGDGLLPWSWAVEHLAQSKNYWFATSHPDGRPHLMAVWAVWLNDRLCFSTGRRSRKARNLAENPRCSVSTERADEPVIMEGIAERITEPDFLKQYADAISAKYKWDTQPTTEGVKDEFGNEGPVFAVRPQRAFGFGEDLPGSATRWIFGDQG